MTSEDVIDRGTPPLTGSEALDLTDLAEIARRILGKPVSRHVVSDDETLENAREAGVPEADLHDDGVLSCGPVW